MVGRLLKERRMPWRLRIAVVLVRGFLRNPAKAFRLAGSVGIDMKSVYRFKLHVHGADFLRDFMQEAESAGMRPFLLWGSLLGLIRDGGFMNHDYDIDMAVLEKDRSKKEQLIAAMRRRGYKVRHDVPNAFSFETSDRLLHLDVDVLYAHRGRLITSAEVDGVFSACEFPADAFEPLTKRQFPKGPAVWVPARSEKILEAIYGDWRTPVTRYDYRTGPLNQIKDPAALGIPRQN